MSLKVNLNELLTRESERVEWKENVADASDVVKTVCAFANDYGNLGGGYVVCGAQEVRDQYGFQSVKLVGLTSARIKEIEGKVLAESRRSIDPPVTPLVEEIETEDPARRVLVLIVPGTRYAHSYRASADASPSYYVRVGRETILARNGVYRELFVRKGALEPWDRRVAPGATIDELDLLALREYLQRMGLWDSSPVIDEILSATTSLSAFVPPLLQREEITGTLRPRNFALLLFGKNPTRVAPGAFVVASRYSGTDRSDSVAQRTELTGSIISQAEKAIEFVAPELTTIFDKESDHPNQMKYPRRALQEAIINAIVHRDYESDQPARVTIFKDRIEVLSPGALPSAVPRDRFVEGKASPYWRNQALAYFFNKLQLAQAEGQGIPTIIRTMRNEGCPDPRFDIGPESLTTVLPAHPRHGIADQLTK